MKVVSIIVVLSLSALAMLALLLPFGVSIEIHSYPNEGYTTFGKARVGEIIVKNEGFFTQSLPLPEITGCMGEQEVPLDAWVASGASVVQGNGQIRSIRLRAKESGVIYLVATDANPYENIKLYYRQPYFSCLQPGTAVT